MIGTVGWVLVIAAVIVWEGISVVIDDPAWPSASDMLRAATRPVLGRWILLGLWLWFGWHVLVTGWSGFLAGPGAIDPPRVSKGPSEILTQIVIPLAGVLGLWVLAVRAGRRERSRPAEERGRPWRAAPLRRRLAHIGVTVAAAYGVFVAIMALFSIITGQLDTPLLGSSAREGAFLAFVVVVPVFVTAAVIGSVWRARRRTRPIAD